MAPFCFVGQWDLDKPNVPDRQGEGAALPRSPAFRKHVTDQQEQAASKSKPANQP